MSINVNKIKLWSVRVFVEQCVIFCYHIDKICISFLFIFDCGKTIHFYTGHFYITQIRIFVNLHLLNSYRIPHIFSSLWQKYTKLLPNSNCIFVIIQKVMFVKFRTISWRFIIDGRIDIPINIFFHCSLAARNVLYICAIRISQYSTRSVMLDVHPVPNSINLFLNTRLQWTRPSIHCNQRVDKFQV